MSGGPKTILFLLRNLYYLRNFEAPIRALLARGHRLTVLSDPAKRLPDEITQQVEDLKAAYPDTLSFGIAQGRSDFRRRLADEIHTARDILRYRTADFAGAASLRRRAVAKATPLARLLYDRDSYADPERNRRADERLAAWDASLPPDEAITARLKDIAPDVVVVSPLVDFRSDQIEWVRAARAMGTPSVLAVASWDNLTNKSGIQTPIDRVLVWNDTQRREAMQLHGVSPDAITVTGAQLYDDWFTRKPGRSRQSFCAALGFDPNRPIILYVGSSSAIAEDEPAFIRHWLTAIRASADADLAGANVLIRPHPMNYSGYANLDLSGLGPAVVSPAHGGLPVTEERRADYFDALYHASLLVGLNTSALIEASILGKPCFTVALAAHRGGQQETLHYHYLTAARILHETRDLDRHCTELAAALHDTTDTNTEAEAFVADFIRPHGRDVAATPLFVDAIETATATSSSQLTAGRAGSRSLLDAAAIASQTSYDVIAFLRGLFTGKPARRQTMSDR